MLLKNDSQPRNQWRSCRVVEVKNDDVSFLHKVKISAGQLDLNSKGR